MTIVICHFCKQPNQFLDDVLWGFDCKGCGKHNDEDTYQIIEGDVQ